VEQENIEMKINELVEEIKMQKFEGTAEEIKIQQILYFDKYVKKNIDYGFEAVNFSLLNPGKENPYDSAYRINGFFYKNPLNDKRIAVCGSISQVAKIVLNKLGIKCDYVWGHFNAGSNANPLYIGHRWNIVNIGEASFMLDFTMEMVKNNIGKDEIYNQSFALFSREELETSNRFLFFNKLAEKESIGGFKIGKNGHEDDFDENGRLKNVILNPNDLYPNLKNLPSEYIDSYYPKNSFKSL